MMRKVLYPIHFLLISGLFILIGDAMGQEQIPPRDPHDGKFASDERVPSGYGHSKFQAKKASSLQSPIDANYLLELSDLLRDSIDVKVYSIMTDPDEKKTFPFSHRFQGKMVNITVSREKDSKAATFEFTEVDSTVQVQVMVKVPLELPDVADLTNEIIKNLVLKTK